MATPRLAGDAQSCPIGVSPVWVSLTCMREQAGGDLASSRPPTQMGNRGHSQRSLPERSRRDGVGGGGWSGWRWGDGTDKPVAGAPPAWWAVGVLRPSPHTRGSQQDGRRAPHPVTRGGLWSCRAPGCPQSHCGGAGGGQRTAALGYSTADRTLGGKICEASPPRRRKRFFPDDQPCWVTSEVKVTSTDSSGLQRSSSVTPGGVGGRGARGEGGAG